MLTPLEPAGDILREMDRDVRDLVRPLDRRDSPVVLDFLRDRCTKMLALLVNVPRLGTRDEQFAWARQLLAHADVINRYTRQAGRRRRDELEEENR